MIDHWLLGRVSPQPSVMLDRVLPAFGRAADYGRLWCVIAAAMSMTRNRRARRAALRGAISVPIAGATANLLGKRLFRRTRPAGIDIPPIRRVVRQPITTGFPSGHAASAAAFATAVALEAPAPLAVPIAAAAGAVAMSRVVAGVHYPSDVLAGAGVGIVVAWLTRWWWPTRPPGPAAAAPASVEVPATLTGRGTVVVVNIGAGTAARQLRHHICVALPDAELITVEPDDLEAALADAATRASVVAVAGGDGTVNAAARHLADTGIPLLVIPAGTLNHFAHELGVHTLEDAAAALREGNAVRVNLARVGSRIFLNTCGIGLYTELVAFRSRWEPRFGKWPALVIGLLDVVRRGEPLSILIDGHPRTVWMIFIGNGRYHPPGFAPAYRTRLDDNHLDVRIIDAATPFTATLMVLAMLTHTVRRCPAYQRETPHELRIDTTNRALPLSLDGEYVQTSEPIEIQIDTAGLLVYRPREQNRNSAV
ncbi:phosphatase PAP2 family protein [Nocardia seriolae]|uniref:bifunctional phosphatase PAP2/diacylglycerol kinase family protein n=1 Tax=Nocardia seriolae TaxID=37332 RepID=UPI0012BD44C6|nr:bifunctional phosphatase PAP2/diacylglycerol kinase family protein [Nocardia seriolae]MTK30585.1 phosphatase PAP2 family protein [Nocardia seriolae]